MVDRRTLDPHAAGSSPAASAQIGVVVQREDMGMAFPECAFDSRRLHEAFSGLSSNGKTLPSHGRNGSSNLLDSTRRNEDGHRVTRHANRKEACHVQVVPDRFRHPRTRILLPSVLAKAFPQPERIESKG